MWKCSSYAGMMELVDMRDLGSRGVIRWGSSPHARTKMNDPTHSEQVDETCRSGRVILYLESLGMPASFEIITPKRIAVPTGGLNRLSRWGLGTPPIQMLVLRALAREHDVTKNSPCCTSKFPTEMTNGGTLAEASVCTFYFSFIRYGRQIVEAAV